MKKAKPKKQVKQPKLKPNKTPFLVVGLGNPGPRFSATRHNAGFMVVDALAEKTGLQFRTPLFKNYAIARDLSKHRGLVIVKPLTYMNRSGNVFASLQRKYKILPQDILIICDNLDLPVGSCRLKTKGSASTHNGLKSISAALGTHQYMRLYFGIGNAERGKTIEHVLGEVSADERKIYSETVERCADAVLSLLDTPVAQVMNVVNRK